jgi:hypothetical protein
MSDERKVDFDLEKRNGNAFFLISGFRAAAKRQGFNDDFIAEVVDEAKSGDFDHLLQTLMRHTQ